MITDNLGYFEIGIYRPKHWENVGTLWRSAWQLGAAGIFTIGGGKAKHQITDVLRVDKRIPLRCYDDFEAFLAARPQGAQLVGVEMGGAPLKTFVHPVRAVYLLGSEVDGLPREVLTKCQHVVEIESVNYASFNVSVSGSLVMYHRLINKLS
ncbi:MAG: RNA methyltransferase [Anaerolineaceae bacterium]|nr:RNA methyltransferase [Anaerolineaceae bacterium]